MTVKEETLNRCLTYFVQETEPEKIVHRLIYLEGEYTRLLERNRELVSRNNVLELETAGE